MHPLNRAYPNIPPDFPFEDFLDGLRQHPAEVGLFVLDLAMGVYRRQLAIVRDELELRNDQTAYLIAKLLASPSRGSHTAQEMLPAARRLEEEALNYAIGRRISYLEAGLKPSP